MCMIAWKPKGVSIPKEYLFNAFLENPDGCGFMYPLEGKLVIEKPFYKYDDFITRYIEVIEKYNNPPVVLHFRLVASGDKSDENTMPMYVKEDKLGVCHNGVISEFSEWGEMWDAKKGKKVSYVITEGLSDTYRFNEEILKKLPRGFLNNEAVMYLLEYLTGGWNKLTFMDGNGKVWFLNKDEGHWHKRVWYSSKSYVSNYFHNLQYYSNKGYYEYWPDDEKEVTIDMQEEPEVTDCYACRSNLYSPLEKYEGFCWDCIVNYNIEIIESEYNDPEVLDDIKLMRESGWLPPYSNKYTRELLNKGDE